MEEKVVHKKTMAVEIAEKLYNSFVDLFSKAKKEKLDNIMSNDLCLEINIGKEDIKIIVYLYRCMIIYNCSESTILRSINLFSEKIKMDIFKDKEISGYREKGKYNIIVKYGIEENH